MGLTRGGAPRASVRVKRPALSTSGLDRRVRSAASTAAASISGTPSSGRLRRCRRFRGLCLDRRARQSGCLHRSCLHAPERPSSAARIGAVESGAPHALPPIGASETAASILRRGLDPRPRPSGSVPACLGLWRRRRPPWQLPWEASARAPVPPPEAVPRSAALPLAAPPPAETATGLCIPGLHTRGSSGQHAFDKLGRLRPAPAARPLAAETAVGQQPERGLHRLHPAVARRFIGETTRWSTNPRPARNSMHAVECRSLAPVSRSTAAFQRTPVRNGPGLPAGTRHSLAPSTLQ